MNRVTYILGAGFSAPLGLPVMSNFLIKSKDLYFSDVERYKHFRSVFNKIQELSICKNYYETNLFNIEEILSIIEMGSFLEGKKLKNDFTKYIIDTIQHYTPVIKGYEGGLPGNWQDFVFGGQGNSELFGYFVSNIFNLAFEKKEESNQRFFQVRRNNQQTSSYSILSLNYDLILENYCNFINMRYQNEVPISFNKDKTANWTDPALFKLHGSVDTGTIVPPTWAKGTHRNIVPTWKNAYQTLINSTHIRFIGYSLPLSDSYIKYLLKSSVVNSPNLKQIDVICLDNDGSVEKRFRDFVHLEYFRFKNGSMVDLFDLLKRKCHSSHSFDAPIIMNKLEEVHEEFMRSQ